MKSIVAALFTVGVIASQANASEGGGKVTFTGEINSGACSIAPDSVDQTVQMGSITSNVLNGGGQSSPVMFDINLVDCDGTKNMVNVTFNGTADSVDATLLALQGGHAKGAAIKLMDSNENKIALGTASSNISIQPGTNTLRLQAALQGTGTVTPGDFTSIANFTLAYN
jgi:type 1 fimbria pilin